VRQIQDDGLSAYRLPIEPAPKRVLMAVDAGVLQAEFQPLSNALSVLGGAEPCADQVLRAPDGRVLVTCFTDMPGVTPAMIDWWFGWHLPESARYRLWHPVAHVAARVMEDRSHLPDDRARYVGNVSYVDEYIGTSLKRLAIAFVPPASFGISNQALIGATAVCAFTSDRVLGGRGGGLIHYVVPVEGGSQMRSGFWLGEIQHQMPLLNRLVGPLINTRAGRRLVVPDQMALSLLQHCGEEMNHLTKFLPMLYRDQYPGG
jgi:hypothetical protein